MLKKLGEEQKTIVIYILFGGLAFVVSMISYIVFLRLSNGNALTANVFSWICAVTFAYITNRIWVFHSRSTGFREIVREAISFFAGRIVTLIMEEGILFIGINVMGIDKIIVKVIAQIIVIISNYIISKVFVF